MRRGRTSDRAVVGDDACSGAARRASSSPCCSSGLFAQKLGLFPLFGAGDGSLLDRLHHLALPAIVMAIAPMALGDEDHARLDARPVRQDHIAFARARGLRSVHVIVVYALRNALIPVLTAAGLLFVGLLTGTVLRRDGLRAPRPRQPADQRRARPATSRSSKGWPCSSASGSSSPTCSSTSPTPSSIRASTSSGGGADDRRHGHRERSPGRSCRPTRRRLRPPLSVLLGDVVLRRHPRRPR